ncbi:hypothetical protein [Amaricoccus macauensis]|uniref:hypothetical protein n=1 Tax=Amaricoccus macauensis TaxID=57001 RepID=UPI003C7AFE47
MLRILQLLAPALIPSWRFFPEVGPSPRLEYAILPELGSSPAEWIAARPRPDRVSIALMLRRMFWNPRWNETLYLVSLSERLAESPTAHSIGEIRRRLARDIGPRDAFFRFRLVFIHREGERLVQFTEFESDVYPLDSTP